MTHQGSMNGIMAEHIVQAKLAHLLNVSVRMPENSIYDVLNAKNKCEIEVKSSMRTDCRSGHQFMISAAQMVKDACDYFVCIAFHDEEDPFNFTAYIVPHKAMINCLTLRKGKSTGYIHLGIGHKSKRKTPDIITLGKNKWDLLIAPKGRKFTYQKNKLAKAMITEYNNYYLIGWKNIEYKGINHLTGTDKKHGRRYKCLLCKSHKRKSLAAMRKHIEIVH
jgi:hypothetical protein